MDAQDIGVVEAYSYRVSARFGSRVLVSKKNEQIELIGPRIGRGIYRLWISLQAVCLLGAIVSLLLVGIRRDWQWVLAMVSLLALHGIIGGVGAGCIWEMENLIAFGKGSRGCSVSFSQRSVREVKIGRGWARRGMWLLLLPYVAGLNSMARNVCVSFLAPDGEFDRDVAYALHMRTPEQAQLLARWLGHSAN